jgi:pentapeptide MXKDX repeat protein
VARWFDEPDSPGVKTFQRREIMTKTLTALTIAAAMALSSTVALAADMKDKMDKKGDAMMKHDTMKKDSMMKGDAMKKDTMMKGDAMKKDKMMKHDTMKKDGMKKGM